MEADPHDKAILDYFADIRERRRSRRAWVAWIAVLAASLFCLFLFNHGFVDGWFGALLGLGGVLGVFLFLAFLSTKAYGRGESSFRWWWMR